MEQKSNQETELQTAYPQEPASMQNNTNVLRRHIKEDPMKEKLAKHRLWMNSIPHEYPMPCCRPMCPDNIFLWSSPPLQTKMRPNRFQYSATPFPGCDTRYR